MNRKKVVAGVGILLLLISVLPQHTRCALSCDVWVDGGCGSTHRIGERMNIYFEVSKAAYIRLWLTYPDGSTTLLTDGDVCSGITYYMSGTVGEPAGKRTVLLEAWSGSDYDSDTCVYYGGKAPGKIRVESTPSGADVYLDGSHKGTTPLTIKDVSPGSYTIKITKTGYEKWTKTVTVYSNETTYVSATLKEASGSIKVTSTPSGAKCYLDGKYKGTTPLTVTKVSPGRHTITLKKDDYYDWEDTVYVSAGETSNIYATLKPKVGSLDVDCNVDGARVYVDGDYEGTTPLRIDDVPVGRHTLRVSADGYYDHTESVTVEVNKTTYVEAALEEKPGFIRVESVPSGAEVYLDGSYQGTTPLTFSVNRGRYTLTLRYSGYYDETQYVDVYPDETTTEQIYLREVFWKTGKFAAGVILCIIVLFVGVFWYKRKQPAAPVPTSASAKSKSAFESVAQIARAPFVPIEMLIHIVLPEKENRCPICDKSLDDGGIVECIHCNEEGFTCKFHTECWEGHKVQQKENGQDKIRCYKHSDIYVPEKSIRPLSQGDVKS